MSRIEALFVKPGSWLCPVLVSLLGAAAPALAQHAIVYDAPGVQADPAIQSSWIAPDGADGDRYAYESFAVGEPVTITDVEWVGTYEGGFSFGRASEFSITFYESANPEGTFPLVENPDTEEAVALSQMETGHNADETFLFNDYYAYQYTLAEPFPASPGQTYWIRILAYQPAVPNWRIARAARGNNKHVEYRNDVNSFRTYTQDVGFTLLTSLGTAYTIGVSAVPAEGGIVSGGNVFASGARVYLYASPATGYTFSGWRRQDSIVSTANPFVFSAAESIDYVAVFESESQGQAVWVLY